MLEGPNINLRVVEQDDIPLYHQWINSPEISGIYNSLRQVSKQFLESAINNLGDNLQVFIVEKKDKTRIGAIVHSLVKAIPYETSEVGYFLVPSEREKGYCTEALKIMVDFLFLTKIISRIQAVTDIRNMGSQKVLEKTGFTKEGIMRNLIFNRGNWRDCALYSILRDEWMEPKILTM